METLGYEAKDVPRKKRRSNRMMKFFSFLLSLARSPLVTPQFTCIYPRYPTFPFFLHHLPTTHLPRHTF
jgi:hypothetical protein